MKKNLKKIKTEITTNELAVMIKNGFDQTATKEDFKYLEKRIDGIDIRLDRIENLLITSIYNRLDRLEDKMLKVETVISK